MKLRDKATVLGIAAKNGVVSATSKLRYRFGGHFMGADSMQAISQLFSPNSPQGATLANLLSGDASSLFGARGLSKLFGNDTGAKCASPPTNGAANTAAASAASTAAGANAASSTDTPPVVDFFGSDDKAEVQDQFEAMVYRSISQKIGMSFDFQQTSVSGSSEGEEGAQSVSAESQQLKFDFFAETRTEELATFQKRTGAVANGLKGQQQSSFAAASQQVSVRFSFSLEISGAALNGYAGTAEGLQNNEDGFDQFLKLVNDTLGESDEVVNKMFQLLGDFFNSNEDIETRFADFMKGLGELDVTDIAKAFAGQTDDSGATGQSGQTLQAQSFSMSIQMEFEFQYQSAGIVQQGDPIMLDLDNDGLELTSYTDGAQFDLQGTGQQVTTAFVTGGDAFLAIDRNGNGTIDSGKELFGEQNGAANGFDELRKLDTNSDGRINSLDKEFDALRLWKDDGDAKSEEGELVSLKDAGVQEINLGYANTNQVAMGGNRIAQVASFLRNDGTRGTAADALLNFVA